MRTAARESTLTVLSDITLSLLPLGIAVQVAQVQPGCHRQWDPKAFSNPFRTIVVFNGVACLLVPALA